MPNINVSIGEFEVYSSGCVNSVNNADALFIINESIKVRLTFRSSEEPNQSMSAEINNTGELHLFLTNFNNPLETEFTDPIEIGILSGRKLFLYLKVLGMSNSTNRTLIYTWLLGGAINNGQ